MRQKLIVLTEAQLLALLVATVCRGKLGAVGVALAFSAAVTAYLVAQVCRGDAPKG